MAKQSAKIASVAAKKPKVVTSLTKNIRGGVAGGNRVLGTAQSTGTRGHAFLSKAIGLRYALDPRVARVTYDLGYKRLLGGGAFKYGPRPDVGVLFKSGRVKVFEIGSKTDDLLRLSERNLIFMSENGINGSVRVYSGARYLNRLWPK